jgi:SRSO17 transposase
MDVELQIWKHLAKDDHLTVATIDEYCAEYAYGVYFNITFPLIVKIFKPKGTLKESDKYKTPSLRDALAFV